MTEYTNSDLFVTQVMQKLSEFRLFSQPLDRIAIAVVCGLTIIIGLLLMTGDRSSARVREFTWQSKQIGSEDNAFVVTFNRPMDRSTVNDQTLKIDPALKGKTSWSGRRMAYTFESPVPYGYNFQISLENAKDRAQKTIQPFQAVFRSRDKIFAYIGAEGDEAGRLVLSNITNKDKKILTPANQTVMDFKPYPDGDKILFSAIDKGVQNQTVVEQKLYTVSTGIQIDAPKPLDASAGFEFLPEGQSSPVPAGQVTPVLDNRDYQNLKFDLSADGEIVVVQRISRKDPNQSGPWIIRKNAEPKPLDNKQPGGDFLITPDGTALAIAQGQGIAILPLEPKADPLDFLPKFGTILSFSRDGSAAAMLKFNADYTRSIFLVTNQGIQKEIFKTTGSVLNAQFSPNKQVLYCLLTNLIPGDKNAQEQPYFAAIDLPAAQKGEPQDKTMHPLVLLPPQREIQMSLSPDGLGLLFDQTQADDRDQAAGQKIANSRIWLLPLSTDLNAKSQPQALPLPGFHPRWLP
jgi:hypothetical protein